MDLLIGTEQEIPGGRSTQGHGPTEEIQAVIFAIIHYIDINLEM